MSEVERFTKAYVMRQNLIKQYQYSLTDYYSLLTEIKEKKEAKNDDPNRVKSYEAQLIRYAEECVKLRTCINNITETNKLCIELMECKDPTLLKNIIDVKK